MPSAKSYSASGSAGSDVELAASVFDVEMNGNLVHQVAVALMANRRQGNHETKVRKEVRGGGRKPFRQKGTGHARQGSSREPHMRGGGVVFGPHKRSHRKRTPVRMKRKALCCVLSDRARNDAICVLDGLSVDAPSTREMAKLFSTISADAQKTLLITAKPERGVVKSISNLNRVVVSNAADVNVLDVLNAKRVIVTQDALPALEERLA